MNDAEKIKEIQCLVDKYKSDIEILKANDNFSDNAKVQTVCVLRECIVDLENILKS